LPAEQPRCSISLEPVPVYTSVNSYHSSYGFCSMSKDVAYVVIMM
jgi:hypothetical protein